MKEKTDRIARVLRNYFNCNDVEISSSDIDKLSFDIQYSNFAKKDDAGVIYYIINVTGDIDDIDGIAEKLVSNQIDLECADNRIFLIVGTVSDKLKATESAYSKALKKLIGEKIETPDIHKYITDVSVDFVSSYNKTFEISISNRVDRLQYKLPDTSEEKADGHVYVASLADIVNLYDRIGDSLFDLNVRYSIKDVLGVEEQIQNTLINCPEKFWFFNNGITLIVDRKAYKCDKTYSISLKTNACFSVINGAQTITTASKFFHRNPDMQEKFRTVKVLLRVIVVDQVNSPFAKDISVSLNRQKSIKQVDIATSISFVKTLNDLMQECDDSAICFELSKRGSIPTCKYHYYIDEFAQIVEAYLNQKPGSARRNKNSLISIVSDTENEQKFLRTNIFQDLHTVADIRKYYTPVNFAYELIEAYKKHPNNYTETDMHYAILSYGRHYFMAATVFCLNNKDASDFSSFVYPQHLDADGLIDRFVSYFFDFLVSKKVDTLDSNNFKTETYYEEFKASAYMDKYNQYICDIFPK